MGYSRAGILAVLGMVALITMQATPHASAQAGVESNVPGAGFDQPSMGASAATATTDATAPTIQVYSRETIVDVVVTDDKDQPVHGLTRSDFTVEEDGKSQPIRGFDEYDKQSSIAAPVQLAPDTYSNADSMPANGPVQILYFDLPYGCSYPPGTDPVADTKQCLIVASPKKYIADYLRSMPTGTQVAIFVYRSDYGLRLVQGFTTDGQLAATAVDNLVILSAGPAPGFDPIAAANQIADYVAGIHGRKNLIWIGSPLPIMRDGGLAWGVRNMTVVHRLMDTYDRFAQDQIAIDPLNPEGVRAPDPKRGVPLALGMDTLAAEEVATGTGGTAAYNTNDFKNAVAKIVDVASHYYTLSYVPTRPASDGHFHPIVIKVRRPGLHLTYRGGYNDERPAPPDAVLKVRMDQSSMGLGTLPSTQLVFNLQVQPTPESVSQTKLVAARRQMQGSKASVSYNLRYIFDPTQVAVKLLPNQGRAASIEFDVAAYDPYGKLVAIRSQTLKLSFTPEEYRQFVGAPFQFNLPIDLPPGKLTLRTGFFDTTGNKVGTLEIPLRVVKGAGER